MNIDIIAVGKIKEKYLSDAVDEYSKRLSRYCRLTVYEAADERADKEASDAEIENVKRSEAERLTKYIRDDAYIVTLEIDGREISSEQLAGNIEKWAVDGKGTIQFIIGGSHGLHNSITSRSDFRLSFSMMTFPHQLMRVILLEQIYRSFKIVHNEPYHK